MPRLLSQAQYTRRGVHLTTGEKRNYSKARINQLVKQGIIKTIKGKIDPHQADIAIEANIDCSNHIKIEKKAQKLKTPQMEFNGNGFNTEVKKTSTKDPFNTEDGNGKGYEGKSLTETRRDLTLLKINHEDLKRQLTEIDLKMRLGELIERSEVVKEFSYRIQIVRQGLLSFHRSLPPLLEGKDARERSDIIKEKIFDLLDRYAQRSGILKDSKHGRKKRLLAGRTGTVAPASGPISQ